MLSKEYHFLSVVASKTNKIAAISAPDFLISSDISTNVSIIPSLSNSLVSDLQ